MSGLKISIITVAFNAATTIDKCITSVIAQNYPNIEYIVIDGNSADTTLAIVNRYLNNISHIVSEPDNGMYYAMNKGIALATGDVIGMLNADDVLASPDILSTVANAFETSGADIIYGDVDYIDKQYKIVRKWRSGNYKHGHFNWGWMPPHPSFYAKSRLFEQFGAYRPQYGTATDYELMLRYIHTHKASVYYMNKVMVHMLVGGVSNKSIGNRFKAWRNDVKAMRNNGILFPLFSIIWKPFRKIRQFITL